MAGGLPNLLTLSRIAAIPVLIAVYYMPSPLGPWLSFALFAAAAVTDALDGRLARRSGRVTAFGRFLDPVADKLLVTSVLVLLVADGRAPALAAALVLCREILVSALREDMARRGAALPVSILAKWKTAVQMAALGLLLVADGAAAVGLAPGAVAGVGAAALWTAAVLGAVTAADYVRRGAPPWRPSRGDGEARE